MEIPKEKEKKKSVYTPKSGWIKYFVVGVRNVKVQTEEYNNSLSLGRDDAASAYVLHPH